MSRYRIVLGALAIFAVLMAQAASLPPKSIAIEAMLDIFTRRDATAVDRYFGEPYIQHNLAIADGDLVLLHSVYEGIPRFEEKPVAAVDLFRIREGRIVEHWDALTFIVPANAAGHTQVDGATQVSDIANTEANRALVRRFVERVLIARALTESPQYIDPQQYTEHTPKASDGLLASGPSAQPAPSRKMQVLHRVLAEGNFVATQSEGLYDDKPAALYDIFRVANGKIVEHWDVLVPLLPRDKWAHENGAY